MGTSHVILRSNAQSIPKDLSEMKSSAPSMMNSGWTSYTPQQPPNESAQLTEGNLRSISEVTSHSSSSIDDDDDGLHEVRLYRSPNYPDYGFHLQFNRVYYIVHQIELNSPAVNGGLRVGDIIRRVNNNPTDQMPHHILVEHISQSKEVILLVQPLAKFLRDNPEMLEPPKERMASTKQKKVEWKNQNIFSKALSKLKSF
jgi:C-terminal processing protease CtpA/Prc